MTKEDIEEFRKCSNCQKVVSKYFWQNIVKGFCSLECTNQYLEEEGFNPINHSNENTSIKQKYLHD